MYLCFEEMTDEFKEDVLHEICRNCVLATKTRKNGKVVDIRCSVHCTPESERCIHNSVIDDVNDILERTNDKIDELIQSA